MTPEIAIVGLACRYPDARSPLELWENALTQRQAFRQIPSERLNRDDYTSPDPMAPDQTYITEAAVIKDYQFDRVRFRIAGSTFRSADLAHWLALDIADQAFQDAGFAQGEGLPLDTTGVFVGNTLTGEFTRAGLMRLRWPYVRRVLDAALREEGWSEAQRHTFCHRLEAQYKAPFPPIGEESLAGGLSNTIAGRICNHFNLKGGGYTVDGACASSLLAVANGCASLAIGDLDVALVGGVDLSLDPFELVGFAKTGALAAHKMRVFDKQSAGFWPGEGCGFAVLMRHEEAVALGCRIYAVIRGWGISSDGSGGITRPEVEGQSLALARAYKRAGFGVETVGYFEGHGTGTYVGDSTELRTLSQARAQADAAIPPAVVSSIKANIGHTKAAAGIAGLIKATMAVYTHILPPATGCEQPHPELTQDTPRLQLLNQAQTWTSAHPRRAAVSAMGFGGINSHVTLEGTTAVPPTTWSPPPSAFRTAAQDAELCLLGAADKAGLQAQITHLLTYVPQLSRAELTDLAAALNQQIDRPSLRAALVATSPAELADKLRLLQTWLADGITTWIDAQTGIFVGDNQVPPRIGFLFPGQSSPARLGGGIWHRCFDFARELYQEANLPTIGDGIATNIAQPAIVTASLAGIQALDRLGITGTVAIGHSLGELTALYWAGAFNQETLLRLAHTRGQAMMQLGHATGSMASIGADKQKVEWLLNGDPVVVACSNSPQQTIISGEETAVQKVMLRAQTCNLKAIRLPVSHAFHSPLVAAATPPLAAHLNTLNFTPLQRTVVSTITGGPLTIEDDLPALLCQQVTAPVLFTQAATHAFNQVDLILEVGPGHVLSKLVDELGYGPVIPLDAGGASLQGLLKAAGATFALGGPLAQEMLFAHRFTRPFDLDWQAQFFVNPCETVPTIKPVTRPLPPAPPPERDPIPPPAVPSPPGSALEVVRQLVAKHAELPLTAIQDQDRLLSDLHLNSITVSQLVIEAARTLGLPTPVAPTDYANVTIAEAAQSLAAQPQEEAPTAERPRLPAGIEAWVRCFTVKREEQPLSPHKPPLQPGTWQVLAPENHPLAAPLEQAFQEWGQGNGVLVCVPPEPGAADIAQLLTAAKAVFAMDENPRFVLVQHQAEAAHHRGGAALARTLHQEVPHVTTCVVDVPVDHPQAVSWIVQEAQTAADYHEVYYDQAGRRYEPTLQHLPLTSASDALPLGPQDVLLVTGGAKGITAECALALALETGAQLALIGRTPPQPGNEPAVNLERFTTLGVSHHYAVADITDAQATAAALQQLEAHLGPITGILHGAARNVPQSLRTLDQTAFQQTVAPKLHGLDNLLAAIDPQQLRLLVTFGSIIARIGLPGEADYAIANEWLAQRVDQFQQTAPHCRCLTVEWSIWSDVGMGVKLGGVDNLVRQGITPIPPDKGTAVLKQLLAQPSTPTTVLVTGRMGTPPTLHMAQPDLPLYRFLEQPRVYYPGIELIVDVSLSGETDPYLDDHVFEGQRLLPGVMGLEAMAQVAVALAQTTTTPTFENVTFSRPVIVPPHQKVTIRLAALQRGPDEVEVVLRSQETDFQVDHFRALCRFEETQPTSPTSTNGCAPLQEIAEALAPINLDPAADLYGRLLFQTGRFQRLTGYRQLVAQHCIAEIAPAAAADWFGRYLSPTTVLSDPGTRDTTIHAIQACIPHATLLPIGVDRLMASTTSQAQPVSVYATERSREGDLFVYDIDVFAEDGRLQEQWQGLRLKMFAHTLPPTSWPAPLLGPYVQRRLQDLVPAHEVTVVLEQSPQDDRQTRSDRAMRRALGRYSPICRRSDGKPETVEGQHISAAHAGPCTLGTASTSLVRCDLERVVNRPSDLWRDLLGDERWALAQQIAQALDESAATAATRVWAASECLTKAGAMLQTPLVLAATTPDGWAIVSAGSSQITTFVTTVDGVETPLVIAILIGEDE